MFQALQDRTEDRDVEDRESEVERDAERDVKRHRKTRTREIKQDTKQETLRVCDKTAWQPLEPQPRLHARRCPTWSILPGTHYPGTHKTETVLSGNGIGWGRCSRVAGGKNWLSSAGELRTKLARFQGWGWLVRGPDCSSFLQLPSAPSYFLPTPP